MRQANKATHTFARVAALFDSPNIYYHVSRCTNDPLY